MKTKKSICIVSSQCLPHIGGIEQYVDNFSRELVRRGHSVTILTSELEGAPEYEQNGKLEIYRLPSVPMMEGRFPVLKLNKKLRKFTADFKKRRFDIMLVNMRFYFISLYAVRLAKKMHLKCIMLDHGTSHLNTGGRITSKIGEWFEHSITWLEKRYCKEFAGVSKATLEWIEHFHIYSDIVLYNAIDINKFNQMKENTKRDFRTELGIPKNDIIISFVGRITIEKGIRELVHVMNKINQVRNDVWLIAAGKGYLMEELTALKCDHIHLVGQISIENVVALLQASEIFCLPSVSEGFPTCVLEAAMCNNFIITTFRGGAKEFIINREYGIILPDNNEKGLYQTIMEVLPQKQYRQQAVRLCYERVLENYTWEQTVNSFLTLLD
jgi:Glycosyltransferase